MTEQRESPALPNAGRLPVWKTVKESYRFVWERPVLLAATLVVPVAIGVIARSIGIMNWDANDFIF